MERKFVYIIVLLLAITFGIADSYINRSLESVEYLKLIDDETEANGLNIDDENIEDNLGEAVSLVTLTLSNKQSNNKNIEYTYKIKIDSISGAHRYIKGNGEDNYQVFTANGETTITLKSNETIIFVDIPTNSSYTITQNEVGNYNTYVGEEKKNTISGTITKDSTITFNNVEDTLPAPVKPDPEKPTEVEDPKNPNEEKENPTTNDYIIPALIALGCLSVLLIISLRLKVKRFE